MSGQFRTWSMFFCFPIDRNCHLSQLSWKIFGVSKNIFLNFPSELLSGSYFITLPGFSSSSGHATPRPAQRGTCTLELATNLRELSQWLEKPLLGPSQNLLDTMLNMKFGCQPNDHNHKRWSCLKALAGFQQGENPSMGLLHAQCNFVKVGWQLKCTLNIVFCEVDTMRLVIRTRKMRKNIYGKKKYLEEGMRGKTNWTFVAKHLLHLLYLSMQCCTFCRDVFVRGKWSDDNEYVVMLRVQRRRVVISYIICNWSQSIVSISPWSPPSPTPPHLGQQDCTLYVQRYYLLLIT